MEAVSIVWEDKSWLSEEHRALADKFLGEYLNSNLLYVPKDYRLVADLMKAELTLGRNSPGYNYILAEHEKEINDWIARRGYALKSPSTDLTDIQNIFPRFESYTIKEPCGGKVDLGFFFQAKVRGIFQKDDRSLGKFTLISGKDGSSFQFYLHGNYHSMYSLDDTLKVLDQPIEIIGLPDGKLELLFEQ